MLKPRLLLALSLLAAPLCLHALDWVQPTPEELSLTSVPEAPGAPAIYLFREQITDDKLHMFSIHARLKVLTSGGVDQGNIELPYYTGGNSGISIDELAGRTIHPDGTVIPFTGKPYDKLIEKQGRVKYTAKVFSLPDVTPGSILEYHYKLHYSDMVFISPDWYIQNELFIRKAHYLWTPTDRDLVTGDSHQAAINALFWTKILPNNVDVISTTNAAHQISYELTINNVPPFPHEDHAPPLNSFTYRVLFYRSPYTTRDEFWSKEGKYWSKEQDKFIGPDSAVRDAAASITAGATSPEDKLHRLYNAVQQLENTNNTREHSSEEDKAEGLKSIHNAGDVLNRKRGSGDQLTLLFVALARAAGFPAYAMEVTRRDRSLFYINFLSLNQLDDNIAVVSVDGKDEFFDPGTHFCPFHQLAWQHQLVQGLRQMPNGNTTISTTPGDSYHDSHVTRVGDLALDEHGSASGSLTLTYTGSPALYWRQRYSAEDEVAVRHDLTRSIEQQLPGGFVIDLVSIDNLSDPDRPLIAKFSAHGPIGTPAGKRLFLPAALFESNVRPMFPEQTRKLAVDMHYGFYYQDAVRFKFPPNLILEAAPNNAKLQYQQFATFDLDSQVSPGAIIVRRNEALGQVLFLPSDYPDLRKFQQGIESADGESVILKEKPITNGATTTAPATQTTATQ